MKIKKCLIILIILVLTFPFLIMILDNFDVLTKIGLSINIEKNSWLAIIFSYYGTIIGAIIGAVVLVFMTKEQLNKTFEENRKQQKELNRISSLPCLSYAFKISKKNSNEPIIIVNYDGKNIKKDIIIPIKYTIKNIGLGAIRNITTGFLLKENSGYSQKSLLMINESLKSELKISFDKEKLEIDKYEQHSKSYSLKFIVYYQDLHYNTYKQVVNLILTISFYKEKNKLKFLNFIRIDEIEHEVLIDKYPTFKWSPFVELVEIPTIDNESKIGSKKE